ncbi:hypothetical protein BKA56DRAFT_620971 [Ilyonectria sp. MPI-CAGE-AT-0026]|nr:hypothetical protein BKA56DRAFT_620971 [Ilyonectria sp. MPI-CAGE-AT-0026]
MLLSRSRASALRLLPLGSWDTHVHVFDASVGAYSPSRAYTPAQASLEKLKRFSAGLTEDARPSNLVLVQPSPYGTDNKVLLHSIKQLRDQGFTSARAIAVVNITTIQDDELWSMHQLGVRGLRLNMVSDGRAVDVDSLRKLVTQAATKIKDLPNWKLELFCPARVWDVIADHIGGLLGHSKLVSAESLTQSIDSTKQPGFQSLVSLAQDSKVIIKISGLYRASNQGDTGCDDLESVIRALGKQVPHRLVWASDWPHTGEGSNRGARDLDKIEDFRTVDNETILKNLREWIGDEETWVNMMVHTPSNVYR